MELQICTPLQVAWNNLAEMIVKGRSLSEKLPSDYLSVPS